MQIRINANINVSKQDCSSHFYNTFNATVNSSLKNTDWSFHYDYVILLNYLMSIHPYSSPSM